MRNHKNLTREGIELICGRSPDLSFALRLADAFPLITVAYVCVKNSYSCATAPDFHRIPYSPK
jgi:hypothetical protein